MALDRKYALAWAWLGRAYADQGAYAWAPHAGAFEQARHAAPASRPSVPSSLPAELSSFVGREREVADCCALLDRLAERGMSVAVWDATTDIGVACFICNVTEAPGNHRSALGAFRGAGCHLDRNIKALVTAVPAATASSPPPQFVRLIQAPCLAKPSRLARVVSHSHLAHCTHGRHTDKGVRTRGLPEPGSPRRS